MDIHAPTTLSDMAGDWGELKGLLTGPTPPNLILCGGAGVGKSCALRLVLGGAISLWLRCSADPTLRDNRDRIKTAARRFGGPAWIVLEHADALHVDAQAFLRRIIEKSAGATRFVLEVRDAAAIAEPLLSRTVLYKVAPLMDYEIRGELMRRCSVSDAERITRECEGNMRWASLQALAQAPQALGSQTTQALAQAPQALGSQTPQAAQTPQGQGADSLIGSVPTNPRTWAEVLAIMEAVQTTGTSPRAYISSTWDRPGGICPWSVLGLELSKTIV
jgi:hypothetical protein